MENLTDLSAINSLDSGIQESGKWHGIFEAIHFENDAHMQAWKNGTAEPTEIVQVDNCLLLTGICEMIRIATGFSTNTFTQGNTQIGVGDSTTAAVNTQTDLQASANKLFVTADVSGGLTVGANGGNTNTWIVQATFGSAQANFPWNEMSVKNSVSGVCLNRAVGTFGTKATGSWVARCTISIT